MITLAIFRAVELEIEEFPQLLLPWSLLILWKLGSGLRATICPVCCNTTSCTDNSCWGCHRGGRNLCDLLVWWGWRSRACCSCLARSPGNGLGSGEQGSSSVVSGLEEERVITGEGWETHMGMGIFFFIFPPRVYGCFGLLEVETRLHASKGFGISTHRPDSHQL